MVELFADRGDPDQTPHSAASDLGLHCLPITLLGVSRLQWVNCFCTWFDLGLGKICTMTYTDRKDPEKAQISVYITCGWGYESLNAQDALDRIFDHYENMSIQIY